ncbi:tricarballylate dehydrogenase [Brevundimonas diminuta]|jgi:predicted Rossmann fold flavoprotein|uniref:NAD(P)/FAD-dependent oxidoreductase n=1 Tax=Brevundimonas diminuta TaxID=293 RepID=UPI000207EDA4|nr:NAD(P)/FAD-dependent oxidoreductase [Brevundimonas diminuta]EGF96847.1 FAD dependent oxidoreductase family protein [Brevundimonas diminuta ATCC 11568]OWR17424.1 aminoacetone oxidase family FAD-binding enzyme [Brevundimonas diminuta]WQE44880.1 NAD(P)/FAD-dependent oxidoreductase [Brevundimonas diminuta]SPU45462.1 tricarballylate dehydrogenase [Brevundimonas diminuta]SUW17397.1 tricarballylate dehydrogenase [Brevundimonas diminuta]
MKSSDIDVLIVGAGAAGMMCAIEAGKRGRRVRVIDHARAPGEKIRISGGGRCNFTNLGTGGANFLGENPRFALSALRRFTQHDFIKMVDHHGIAWHEKTLGQLFCDDSAKQIIRMLTDEMKAAGVTLSLGVGVKAVERAGGRFQIDLDDGSRVTATSLIVATGGKSIPKMGATGWGYEVARRFGLRVTDTRPALVPLTFEPGLLEQLKPLAGVSVDAVVRHKAPKDAGAGRPAKETVFREGLLFTHRGLSGPSILQISSYWREGEAITVDLAPDRDAAAEILAAKSENGKQAVHTAVGHVVPRRLAEALCARENLSGKLAEVGDKKLRALAEAVNAWTVKPVGSEGYRTAEVTLGGVDTAALDQQTMEAKAIPGLFFIGEVADVTGWLGGYNFQWAWSSGWAAGQHC